MPYPPKNLRFERYLDNIFRYNDMDNVNTEINLFTQKQVS